MVSIKTTSEDLKNVLNSRRISVICTEVQSVGMARTRSPIWQQFSKRVLFGVNAKGQVFRTHFRMISVVNGPSLRPGLEFGLVQSEVSRNKTRFFLISTQLSSGRFQLG